MKNELILQPIQFHLMIPLQFLVSDEGSMMLTNDVNRPNKASDNSVKEEGKETSFNFWQLQKHFFPIVETFS